ncbi:MAG: phenylacetate--CoA ligase family protein [bacterium]
MEVRWDLNRLRNAISLVRHVVGALSLDRLSRDPDGLRRLQEFRLRRLVAHAYARVPFYRRWFDDAGAHPDQIRTLDDLARLPLLTKKLLREVPSDDLLDRGARREECFLTETSGSTGQPTRIYKDTRAIFSIAGWGSPMMIARWLGRPGWRMMTMLVRDEHSIETVMMRVLPRFMLRIREADALADPAEQAARLNAFRPDLLVSYPSTLRNLALYARDRGLTLHRPQAIIWSAEVLDPPTRALIESVFRSELFAAYGSTEAGLMGLECVYHRGVHVISTRVIVEVLRDGAPAPPGEPGDVVVTDLTNFVFPIIRYAGMGDAARWSPARCPCGRALPLLEMIEGRRVDSFVLPDGRIIHPYTLTLAIQNVPGILQYQLVQERPDRVRVLLARIDTDGQSAAQAITVALGAILGPQVSVEVQPVPAIPLAPGERIPRVVRSLVPH